MTPTKIFTIVAFVIVGALASAAFINPVHLKKPVADSKGIAVVELFTSEGCSSCPPADELVARIQKEDNDKPVYILAFHVDYWNRLGWKDVFSSADYSKRQNEYANYLHLQSVYTPQIVVNGKTEFVGSQETTLRNAISASLNKAPEAQLTLSATGFNQPQTNIKYTIEGSGKNTILVLAAIQKSAQTKVERGENRGHTLSHIQIVRKLQTVSLTGKSGQVEMALPHGFNSQNWEVIGILQNTLNGAVTGASKVSFIAAANTDNAAVKNSK
jgi:hypothetical protein